MRYELLRETEMLLEKKRKKHKRPSVLKYAARRKHSRQGPFYGGWGGGWGAYWNNSGGDGGGDGGGGDGGGGGE